MLQGKRPSVRRAILVVELLGSILLAFYLGARFGMIYKFQQMAYELPRGENASASLKRLLFLQPSYGEFGQDLWVALAVAHGKQNGYYVDVGSGDGVIQSNTKLLDRMGWQGVCIDPFPTNMQTRTCQMIQQPVWGESGKKVTFRQAGAVGGIDTTLNTYKGQASASKDVEFTTATLDEILDKAKAPKWIDYMNLDIEGAEYEALRGFSLDRYSVGSLTIEHNFEPEKRELIRKHMESKGYVRVRSWEVDDWYVHPSLAGQYRTYLAYASGKWVYRTARK